MNISHCGKMEPTNFHMFLASNTNPVEFPDNTPADFTTLYGESVNLDGNWEVGVKQMSYPNGVFTTTGTETLSVVRNGAGLLEGKKALISEDQQYYDLDVYKVKKPPLLKNNTYDPNQIVENFNALPIKRLIYLEYNAKHNKIILHVNMYEVSVGLSRNFGQTILGMPRQLLYPTGTWWSYEYSREPRKPSKEDWTVWVYPMYRLTKQVTYTICEKDEDMSLDNMYKRIHSFSKQHNVMWQRHSQTDRYGKMTIMAVESKPDPRKEVDVALITFNAASLWMLGVAYGFFEPKLDLSQGLWPGKYTRRKSYKECKYFGKEPVLMHFWSRKISSRSPYHCFQVHDPWTKLTFPRKTFQTPEELLAFIKTFHQPQDGFYKPVEFSYDSKSKHFQLNVPLVSCVQMDPIVCDILGFKHKYFSGQKFTAEYIPALDRAIDNLFVYSDITEHIFVGNTKAPVICIIPRDKEKEKVHGGISSWAVENPTYIPVIRQAFNQQRIIIMDEAGVPIPFKTGKTVLLLHFRKRF